MKIKSLRLALWEGGNPEYPTGAGSSVNLWCGLDRRQGETTSAGDAPPVSATRERRARSIKIFGAGSTGAKAKRRQRATPRQFQRPASAAPEASRSLV